MLGYVQALMGANWSHEVYPAVVALPIALCALVVAATAYSVCQRMLLSLLCGATVGLTLNGLTFGAGNGFMPQTWGLAFVAGSLALTGLTLERSIRYSSTKKVLMHWIPMALLFSAAIHCYSEISPFLVTTTGLVFLIAIVSLRRHWRRLLIVGIWLGSMTAILVNLEWIRIIRAVRSQVSAAVGAPVNWPAGEFLRHAMGLRSGYWDLDLPLFTVRTTGVACVAALGLMVAGIWWCCRCRGRLLQIVPHVVFLFLAALAFVYFRFAVPSHWPVGTGQSWNQFKLSNWATPCLFCLLAAGLAAIARKNRIRSTLMSVGLLAILTIGMKRHAQLANPRTSQLRQDAGLSYDPFSVFPNLHQFSAYVPVSIPIYLNLNENSAKMRQMLMYALLDRPLAGDWTGDDYLSALREDQRRQTSEPCRWMIATDASAPPTARRIGNLYLSPCPGTFLSLQSATGGYGREMDATGWWYWTARQLHFIYRVRGEQPGRVIVSFTCVAVSDHRAVRLTVDGKTTDLDLMAGWHNWTSLPIEINHVADSIEVAFDCDVPPVRLSEQDSREASYLIKNLVLRRVDQNQTD
jgi:hypothetical protein